jgi:hypothetical protein
LLACCHRVIFVCMRQQVWVAKIYKEA